jgi:hypothetical protein
MRNNITTRKSILLRPALQAIVRTCLLAFTLLLSGGPGFSELVIEGQTDRLVLEAKQEPLNDIIAALGARYDVRLKSPLAVNVRVGGYYTGSLHYIIRRLLAGYDFVLAIRQNGRVESIDITVFGRSNTAAANSQPVFRPPSEPPAMTGFTN